ISFVNGKQSSIGDLPCVVFEKNGKIVMEAWYRKGVMHRLNGPAFTDGTIMHYYLFGRKIIPQNTHCSYVINSSNGSIQRQCCEKGKYELYGLKFCKTHKNYMENYS